TPALRSLRLHTTASCRSAAGIDVILTIDSDFGHAGLDGPKGTGAEVGGPSFFPRRIAESIGELLQPSDVSDRLGLSPQVGILVARDDPTEQPLRGVQLRLIRSRRGVSRVCLRAEQPVRHML